MNKAIRRHPNLSWLTLYTLLFILIAGATVGWMLCFKKSLIWNVDGLSQHYNALLYFRQWGRTLLSGLLHGEFKIPLWDLSLGQGSDILSTLHYYSFGDPLNLFSVLVPLRFMEVYYSFLCVFRVWLAGLSFALFCRHRKKARWVVLCGSLAYAWCYWSVAALRHPFFINPLIYFPLILLGIDKIFDKERPYVFILSLALAAISNGYFFYTVCIFMVLYAVLRYVTLHKGFRLADALGWLGRFAGYSVIGLAMAGLVFLPFAFSVLQAGRLSVDNTIPVLYSFSFYEKYFTGFLSGEAGFWTELGFTGIGVLATVLLFIRKEKTTLKIGFILMNLFMLIPYCGHLLNGFAYACNRASWAFPFLMAFLLVEMLPTLFDLSDKQKKITFLILSVYALLCLIGVSGRTKAVFSAAVIMLLTAALVLFVVSEPKRIKAVLVVSLTLSLSVQAIYRNSFFDNNYTSNIYTDFRVANATYAVRSAAAGLSSYAGGETVRYDQWNTGDVDNIAWHHGLYGTSFYWSVANPHLAELQHSLFLNHPFDQRYYDLDSRTLLDNLFGAKYFITGNPAFVPYGFEDTGHLLYADCLLYQNKQPTGLATLYSTQISKEEYDRMSMARRQQALLQTAVLNDGALPSAELSFSDVVPEQTVTLSEGITVDGTQYHVTVPQATLTFSFDPTPNSETYLVLEGLDFHGIHPVDLLKETGWKGYNLWRKAKTYYDNLAWSEATSMYLNISSGNRKKEINYITPKDPFYCGKHDFAVNLGYTEKGMDSIELTFRSVGDYQITKAYVVSQPLDELPNYEAVRNYPLCSETVLSCNALSTTVQAKKESVVCFSVPYSEGWSATVDGEPAEVYQTNIAFTGVKVPVGEHTVVLNYLTPGLRLGLILSAGGVGSFVILIAVWETVKKRNRRRKAPKQ